MAGQLHCCFSRQRECRALPLSIARRSSSFPAASIDVPMDFSLDPELARLQRRTRDFVNEIIMPVES